jgi:hypothetical protein
MQHRLSNCLVCRRGSRHISKAHLGQIRMLHLLARKASRCHMIQISKACHCIDVWFVPRQMHGEQSSKLFDLIFPRASSADPCAKSSNTLASFRHLFTFLQCAPVFGHDALKIKFRSNHSKEMTTIQPQRSSNRQNAAGGSSATVIGTHPSIP